MSARKPEFPRIRIALGKSAHFACLPGGTLDALAEAAVIERYDHGGCVDSAAAPLDKLWFVLEGGLIAYWINAFGEATPVATLTPGTFYNSAALVDEGERSSQCQAERGTVLAVIPGPAVRERARRDSELAMCIARILLRRFQAALSIYADAIAAPLRLRIVRRLLAQALALDGREDGAEIPVPFAQGDIALTLGVSRSKLNAELRRLEDEGFVRLGYGKLYVRSVKGLEKISGGPVFVF